jgi:hypothetical protein
MFRDSQSFHNITLNQVQRFFKQISGQKLLDGITINNIFCVYTQSNDNTLECLKQEKNIGRFNIQILEYDNEYKSVSSVDNKDRLAGLAKCGNYGLEKARVDCDYLFLIESDLIVYDYFLLFKLYKSFSEVENLACVSPLIFLDINHDCFYDTLCFKNLDGSQWTNHKPWSPNLNKYIKYVDMSCVGSCSLINQEVLSKGINFGDNGYLTLCKQIIDLKKKIVVNKECRIYHPSNNSICGRWI